MANSKVLIEVIATGKGLKVVAKDTEAVVQSTKQLEKEQKKATKSTKQQTDSHAKYDKQNKSVYQGNLSSAKSFSKMKETIGGGSSGLVQAYATLAANVFAATAAFTALRQASQVQQLTEGLQALGAASGRNLSVLADKIVEATGNALALDQALRTASVGASAGFDSTQIEGLAEVGRLAAISLGRDVGDAVDRLTRGAAKLEPEILDELGIFVRLDDAAAKYAASLGVSASQLSRFEKRQAFANEILEQGRRKFAEVSDIPPSPFDKLAASMANLSRTLLDFFNTVLGPIAGFFAENTVALAGFFAMITKGIIQQALPALGKFSTIARNTAADAFGFAQGEIARTEAKIASQLKEVKGIKMVTGEYQNYFKKIQSGKFTLKDLENANKALADSIRRRQQAINSGQTKNIALAKQNIAAIQEEKRAVENLIVSETKRLKLQGGAGIAGANQKFSGRESRIFEGLDKDIMEGNAFKGFQKAFTKVRATTRGYGRDIRAATMGTKMFGITLGKGVLGKALVSARIAMKSFGLTARLSIKGIFTAIPVIGQLLLVIDLLIAGLKSAIKFFAGFGREASEAEKKAKQFAKEQDNFAMIQERYADGAINVRKSVISQGNATKSLIKSSKELGEQQRKGFEEAGFAGKLLILTFATLKMRVMQVGIVFRSIFTGLRNFMLKNVTIPIQEFIISTQKMLNSFIETANLLPGTDMTPFNVEQSERDLEAMNKQLEHSEMATKRLFNASDLGLLGPMIATSAEFETFQQIITGTGEASDELRNKFQNLTNAEIANIITGRASAETLAKLSDEQNKLVAGLDANGDEIISYTESLDLLTALTEDGTKETTSFGTAIENLGNIFRESEQKAAEFLNSFKVSNSFLQISGEFKNVTRELEKIPFDGTAEQAAALLDTVGQAGKGFTDLIFGPQSEKEAEATMNAFKEATKITTDMTLEEKEKALAIQEAGVGAFRLRQELGLGKKEIEAAVVNAANLLKTIGQLQALEKSRLSLLQRQQSTLKTASKTSTTAAKLNVSLNNQQVDLVDARLSKEIELAEGLLDSNTKRAIAEGDISKLEGEQFERAVKYLDLQEQQGKNASKRISDAEQQLQVDQAILAVAQQQAKLDTETANVALKQTIQQQKAANRAAGVGNTLTPAQKLRNEKTLAQIKIDTLDREIENLTEKLRIERLLIKARMIANGISMEEGSLGAQILADLKDAATVQENILKKKREGLVIDRDSVGDSAFTGLLAGGEGQGLLDSIGLFNEQGDQGKLGDNQNLLEGLSDATKPLRDQLMALGPEGELVATAQQGILTLASAFDVVQGAGLGSAEGLAAVGSAISTISSMMAASSKAQMADIDNQIKAEQQRDGKSKESLAKIKALEKQKDALAKKAFERNKKLQMAQVIANTAAGVMKTMGDTGFFGAPLAMMVAAMGMAQLAIIKKQKYNSSSSDVQAPNTALKIGKRSNAVDVSRQATGGELNYLRGGRTSGQDLGGAGGSLPGAAMGRKGYADGGVVVGERGPEVITPTAPVDVTPNYALGGGTSNVNFTINAVDAAGVEDVLMNQRGNIIRMIREAANDHGEMFLEDIDTQTYGSST